MGRSKARKSKSNGVSASKSNSVELKSGNDLPIKKPSRSSQRVTKEKEGKPVAKRQSTRSKEPESDSSDDEVLASKVATPDRGKQAETKKTQIGAKSEESSADKREPAEKVNSVK